MSGVSVSILPIEHIILCLRSPWGVFWGYLGGGGEVGGRSREQRQKYLWIRDEVEWKFDGTFIEYEDEAKIKFKLWIYLFHAYEFFEDFHHNSVELLNWFASNFGIW